MVIIHERDGRVIVSHVSASAMRPEVTHEEITNAAEIAAAIAAKEQPPAPIIETVIDMPAETEQEFEARMIAALVDAGARHIIVDTVDLPSPPPERWVVDWETGAVTLGPLPAAALPPLSAVQLRLGLIAGGILPSQVQAIIDAMPDAVARETAHAYWNYAQTYHRDHALIDQLADALGLSDAQVDAMWVAAAQMG